MNARTAPHSLEAEQSVLGAIMLDNAVAARTGNLAPLDFFVQGHAEIYNAAMKLIAAGTAVDVVTLSDELKRRKQLDNVGGDAYLGALVENVPTAANVTHYAQIVHEHALRRRLAATADEISTAALTPNGRSVLDVFAAARQRIDALAIRYVNPAIELVRADAIRPERIEWLWDGYIARGILHLIAGAPGTGKTTLALAIAATVSRGGCWPDGSRTTQGNVLIWSGEDAAANTLVPRLIAMGAEMSRVHIVSSVSDSTGERRCFDPAQDFPELVLAAGRLPGLRLMIVDPIASVVAGDSHHNSETRRGLQPVVEFAERVRCAIQGVTHFAKASSGRDPIERVIGSIAFAAVARIIMATARLPEDQGGGRVFARAKSNVGPDGGGFRYELRQGELEGEYRGIVASRIEWGVPIDGTAREILAQAETDTDPSEQTERAEAAEWLKALLAEAGGSMAKVDVVRAATRAGYKERTIQRARTTAGVIVDITGFGSQKRSVWQLASSIVPPTVSIVPTADAGMNGTHGGMNGGAAAGNGGSEAEVF